MKLTEIRDSAITELRNALFFRTKDPYTVLTKAIARAYNKGWYDAIEDKDSAPDGEKLLR